MFNVAFLRVNGCHSDNLNSRAEVPTGWNVFIHLYRTTQLGESPHPVFGREAHISMVRHQDQVLPTPGTIIQGFRDLSNAGAREALGLAGQAPARGDRSLRVPRARQAGQGTRGEKAAGPTLTAAAPLQSPTTLGGPAPPRSRDPSPPFPADDTRRFRKRHIRRPLRPLPLVCLLHSQ